MTGLRLSIETVPPLSIVWAILFSVKEVNAATERAALHGDAAEKCTDQIKIAVIGAGITGAATTAFLRRLEATRGRTWQEAGRADTVGQSARTRALRIDVFEASERMGGRLDFITLPGGHVEMGGESINYNNMYMEAFINIYQSDHQELGETAERVDGNGSADKVLRWPLLQFLLNGDPVETSKAFSISLIRWLRDTMLSPWLRLYKVLDRNTESLFNISNPPQGDNPPVHMPRAFATGLEMLDAVGLSQWVFGNLSSLTERLTPQPPFPLIESIALSVYTQSSRLLQGLAGMVSLLGAYGDELPTRVPHRRVVEHLVKQYADGTYLNCEVEKILQEATVTQRGTQSQVYTLEASNCASLESHRLRHRKYDYVVIATPLSKTLRIFRQTEARDPIELTVPYFEYQHVFVTVVQAAEIKEGATLVRGMTRVVATPEHSGSIGTLFVSACGTGEQDEVPFVVCKLKSGRELSDLELAELFRDIRLIERRCWKAYPYMHLFAHHPPTDSNTYSAEATNFRLMPGLYYPNAFEGLFSCMEGQAMAARNVAQLIMNSLESDT